MTFWQSIELYTFRATDNHAIKNGHYSIQRIQNNLFVKCTNYTVLEQAAETQLI